MSKADDCCPGEPCYGDPRGLHSLDCPVYMRWADAHDAASRVRMGRERPTPVVSAVTLAWLAGYRQGLREGRITRSGVSPGNP